LGDEGVVDNLLAPDLDFPLKEDVEVVLGGNEVLDHELEGFQDGLSRYLILLLEVFE
jgi:hypothetical protein